MNKPSSPPFSPPTLLLSTVLVFAASGCDDTQVLGTDVEGITPASCSDGLDNDGDGLVDCSDPDCLAPGGEGLPSPCKIADAGAPLPPDGDLLPFPDASVPPPDASLPGLCNAVTQTGCSAGEKCAFVVDDIVTGAGHTQCTPDGNVPVGGDCLTPQANGQSDNCEAGGYCYLGKCQSVCTTISPSCPDNGVCVSFTGLGDFDVCLAGCDPLAPLDAYDCPDSPVAQGCYLISEGAACSAISAEGQPGDPCQFLNSCERGSGCFGDGMGNGVCRKYCGPVDGCFTFDDPAVPTSCNCGGCGPTELCLSIQDEPVVGVCTPAPNVGCDCLASPVCPPAP